MHVGSRNSSLTDPPTPRRFSGCPALGSSSSAMPSSFCSGFILNLIPGAISTKSVDPVAVCSAIIFAISSNYGCDEEAEERRREDGEGGAKGIRATHTRLMWGGINFNISLQFQTIGTPSEQTVQYARTGVHNARACTAKHTHRQAVGSIPCGRFAVMLAIAFFSFLVRLESVWERRKKKRREKKKKKKRKRRGEEKEKCCIISNACGKVGTFLAEFN